MKLLKNFLVALSMLLIGTTASAQQFRMLSSWDQNYAYNPHILYPFFEGVEKASNGRMTFEFFGPETVAPFEQLEPVGSGAFDFLFTHGAYHFGTSPLMLVADALDGDLTKMRESGVFEYLDEQYRKYGLKLVMLPITPEGAYHIILKNPVNAQGDLAGRKIRGSLTYKGIIEMLKATLVVLPPSDIYTGLEKGVIDGAAWPIIGVMDYRWNEVAKYLLRPGFGVNYEPIFMNLNAWNKLSKEDQQIILDVSLEVEKHWYKVAPKVWKEEEDALIAKGMLVTEMGASQKAQLREAWAKGLWELAASKNKDATTAFYEFAVSKGMAK